MRSRARRSSTSRRSRWRRRGAGRHRAERRGKVDAPPRPRRSSRGRPGAPCVPAAGVSRTEAERLAWRRRMACVFQEPLLCRRTVARQCAAARCRLRGVPRGGGRPARRATGSAASASRALADRPAGPAVGRRGPADEPRPGLRHRAGGAVSRRALRGAGRRRRARRCSTTWGGSSARPGPRRCCVTHDRAEALRLGDRVAVLLDGAAGPARAARQRSSARPAARRWPASSASRTSCPGGVRRTPTA